jgi:hypothetical protein
VLVTKSSNSESSHLSSAMSIDAKAFEAVSQDRPSLLPYLCSLITPRVKELCFVPLNGEMHSEALQSHIEVLVFLEPVPLFKCLHDTAVPLVIGKSVQSAHSIVLLNQHIAPAKKVDFHTTLPVPI